MPSQSTEEPGAILKSPQRFMLYHEVIRELKRRNEDYSSALSNVLNLLISKDSFEQTIGWSILKNHFPHIAIELPDGGQKGSSELLGAVAQLKARFANAPPGNQQPRNAS